jgi:caffeoyl-CoA O-methyltransferase
MLLYIYMDSFEKVCKELEERDRIAAEAHTNGEQAMRLWSIMPTTAHTLVTLIVKHKPHTILELGTGGGYSTIWFANTLKNFGGKVYTMERDPIKIEIAKETFTKAGLNQYIELIEGEIKDNLLNWNKPIDLLFIDANKKGYLPYLRQLEAFLQPGSLVVADNVINRADMVKDYMQYVTTSPDYQTTLLTIDNGISISIRK